MSRVWVTTSSTTLEAMVNPIIAACEQGYVPSTLYFLTNPDVDEQVERAIEVAETAITEYGGEPPEANRRALEVDTEFEEIYAHFRDAIDTAKQADDAVAVDITPGRKFMSAIAFATGLRYDADHVFYFYMTSGDYRGQSYPEMPRSATRLYDFTEVL